MESAPGAGHAHEVTDRDGLHDPSLPSASRWALGNRSHRRADPSPIDAHSLGCQRFRWRVTTAAAEPSDGCRLGRSGQADDPPTQLASTPIDRSCSRQDTAVAWSSNALTDSQPSTRGSPISTACSLATRPFRKRGIGISPAYPSAASSLTPKATGRVGRAVRQQAPGPRDRRPATRSWGTSSRLGSRDPQSRYSASELSDLIRIKAEAGGASRRCERESRRSCAAVRSVTAFATGGGSLRVCQRRR
jgi:hypothetical protein